MKEKQKLGKWKKKLKSEKNNEEKFRKTEFHHQFVENPPKFEVSTKPSKSSSNFLQGRSKKRQEKRKWEKSRNFIFFQGSYLQTF